MEKTNIRVLGLVFFVIVSAFAFPFEAEAAGPWKGQIVDRETGKPLEGVVVLAVWTKCGFIVMDGCAEYGDCEEAVTGQEGRFVIQARWYFSLFRPFSSLKGPAFYIFKAGYGRWQFQGYDTWSKDALESEEQRKKAWKQFEGEGVVLELPVLKTRNERLKFLGHVEAPGDIPDDRIPKYLQTYSQERVNLGLTPSRRGKK